MIQGFRQSTSCPYFGALSFEAAPAATLGLQAEAPPKIGEYLDQAPGGFIGSGGGVGVEGAGSRGEVSVRR